MDAHQDYMDHRKAALKEKFRPYVQAGKQLTGLDGSELEIWNEVIREERRRKLNKIKFSKLVKASQLVAVYQKDKTKNKGKAPCCIVITESKPGKIEAELQAAFKKYKASK